MLKLLQQNKTVAVIIILIIIIVLYLRFGRKDVSKKEKASNKSSRDTRGSRNSKRSGGRKEKASGGNRKSSPKKNGRNSRSNRNSRHDEENPREKQTVDFHNDDDDSSSSEDDDLHEDAEELYNLVHEGMCTGMQQSEFEQAVDDLADAFIFIELKQLYNQCIDKSMDPEKTISVNDYVRILKREE